VSSVVLEIDAADQRRSSRRSRGRPAQRGVGIMPYLLVAPAALYLVIFTAVPMVRGLWVSFTNTSLLNPTGGTFAGVENYADLLSDSHFWSSVGTTILYTAGTVIGSILLGTIAAVAINEGVPGRAFLRAILTIPWAVP